MKKRMQQILKEEKGFAEIEMILVLAVVMILAMMILVLFTSGDDTYDESYDNAQYAEAYEEERIDLLKDVRELKDEVEAGSLDNETFVEINEIDEKLGSLEGSELDEQVTKDITSLIQNPNDVALKEKAVKQLEDVEGYLLALATDTF